MSKRKLYASQPLYVSLENFYPTTKTITHKYESIKDLPLNMFIFQKPFSNRHPAFL